LTLDYEDLFVDEVMRECWERKAQVIEDYGGVEGYLKHLREDPCLRPDGAPWLEVSPEEIVVFHAKPIQY
jgi:hypothetical protein